MFLPHAITRVFVEIRGQSNNPVKDRLQAAGGNKLTDLRSNATNDADYGGVSSAGRFAADIEPFQFKA
jgi:hypothetical protein